MDPLTILTGLAVLAAIALAFWVAPEVKDAFGEPYGDVPHIPPEEWAGRQSLPSGGRVGNDANQPKTQQAKHGGKRNNR